MKWYIGQEIVAVVDHHQGCFKKGDIFIIKGLNSAFCKCMKIVIDIGYVGNGITHCTICGKKKQFSNIWWFSENRFAPIDTQAITQLLEEVKVSVA